MTTPSHVHAAIEDLKARRAKIDAAIAGLEEVFGLSTSDSRPAAAPTPRTRKAWPKKIGHAPSADDKAILAHLKAKGWVQPRDVAKALSIEKMKLRRQLKALLRAKRVVAIGTTGARRFALAGTPPPKEAL